MKKYSVLFQVHASTYIEVEANSEEEARSKAEASVVSPAVCNRCSDDIDVGEIGEILEVIEL